MTKTRQISSAEFRGFMKRLGFKEILTENAWVFKHPSEGLLVFRLYGEREPLAERDLRSARRFLDYKGLLKADEFDEFVEKASTPA